MYGAAQVGQLAMREYVFVEKLSCTEVAVSFIRMGCRNAVIHGQATILEQFLHATEIGRQILAAHMFEHPHTGNPIELPFYIAIILQADFDAVLQAGLFDAFHCQVVLLL